jgi:hypothetical protein
MFVFKLDMFETNVRFCLFLNWICLKSKRDSICFILKDLYFSINRGCCIHRKLKRARE